MFGRGSVGLEPSNIRERLWEQPSRPTNVPVRPPPEQVRRYTLGGCPANDRLTVSFERTERAETDPETVRRTIRGRSREITERELEAVFSKLEAQGELTDEQRMVIRETATAIVDGLLAPAEATLTQASANDRTVLETTIELFDPDRQ